MACRLDNPPAATIGDEIEAATSALRAAGAAAPGMLALRTWAVLAQTSPGETWIGRGQPAPSALMAQFRESIVRQAAGEPFQYAVGRAGFRLLELVVDRRVLIPRSETEGLVDQVLEFARQRGRWGVAADIGTGSGAIALSLATEGAFERVLALDLSGDDGRALETQ